MYSVGSPDKIDSIRVITCKQSIVQRSPQHIHTIISHPSVAERTQSSSIISSPKFMYSQTPRNHTTGNRKTNLERYQETPNHEDKGLSHRHFHDSITAASPMYNTESRRIDPTTKLPSAQVDVSSTPITSEHTHAKRNHLPGSGRLESLMTNHQLQY